MFRHISTVLSLVPTPLLILISSSSALYLSNQAELHHRCGVLVPFVVGFAAMLTVGLLLYALSGKRWFRFALTAYYVMGPFFLLFGVLRNLETQHPFLGPLYQTGIGLATWPVLFVAVTLVVSIRVPRDSLTRASAVFGALLLVSESLVFWSKVESPRSETAELESMLNAQTIDLETEVVKPRRADISIQLVALAWVPFWQDELGGRTPAWS